MPNEHPQAQLADRSDALADAEQRFSDLEQVMTRIAQRTATGGGPGSGPSSRPGSVAAPSLGSPLLAAASAAAQRMGSAGGHETLRLRP